jgi:hypothetical protein
MERNIIYMDVFFKIERLLILCLRDRNGSESVHIVDFTQKITMNVVHLSSGQISLKGFLSITMMSSREPQKIFCLSFGESSIGVFEVEDEKVTRYLKNAGPESLDLRKNPPNARNVKCLGLLPNGSLLAVTHTDSDIVIIVIDGPLVMYGEQNSR